MLLEVSGDLTCYSDTLRTRGEGWRSELILLSMFGPRNAVRAAWAKLSASTRRGQASIEISGTHVQKAEGAAYSTASAPLERGLVHLIIWHQQLGHNAPDAGYIYQAGPDAERRYFDRLAKRCPVPLRSSWVEPLWRIGRERDAIAEVKGHGREVWRIDTTRETWEPIVRDALVAKELR